ncbi:bridge-like lipid transfer protein family member 2 isoform X3 [Rhopilema esculentum]|uniref:bridge-like lipid transfer protein family member 2 isoform X3 n=1 Tax=Rhopilema esculentum TaxID=499914 RepID=UPI0031E1B7F8
MLRLSCMKKRRRRMLQNRNKNLSQISVKKTGKSNGLLYQILLYTLQYVGIEVPEINVLATKGDLKMIWRSKLRFLVGRHGSEKFNLSIEIHDTTVKLLEECQPIMECCLFSQISANVTPARITRPSEIKVKLSRVTLSCREGLLKRVGKPRINRRDDSQDIDSREPVDTESSSELPLLQKMDQLPLSSTLVLEDCKIVFISSQGREICLSWHCELALKQFLDDAGDGETTSYGLSLDLTGLVLNTSRNKLLLNKQIECSVKLTTGTDLSHGTINANFDTFHASMIEEELNFWIAEKRKCTPEAEDSGHGTPVPRKRRKESNIIKFLKTLNWSVKAVVRNCSCDIMATAKETGQSYPILNTYLGEFELNIAFEKQDGKNNFSLRSNIGLSNLYSYVCQLESSQKFRTCVDGPDKPAILPSSEVHVWGRGFELGKATLEVSSEQILIDCSMPVILKASCQIANVASELSLPVVAAAKDIILFIEGLKLRRSSAVYAQKPSEPREKVKIHVDVDVRITSVNLFLLGERSNGANSLVIKIDGADITTGSKDEPILWEVNELKLCRLRDIAQNQPHKCRDSSTVDQCILYFPSVATCFFRKKQPKSLTVSIQDCLFDWDTAKHMVIHEQINNLIEAKSLLAGSLSNGSGSPNVEKSSKNQMDVKIDIISACMKMATSNENSFGLKMENLSLQYNANEQSVKASDVSVLFDENPILKFQEIELGKIESEDLQESRSKFSEISAKNDRAFLLVMEACRMTFPYKFDFATSLEKLLNVFKMLKVLHKKPKAPGYQEPLPPDLRICCSILTFELEDDPFEVRLEQNYLLRMDEMEECQEREKKLKERLKDIQGAFVSSNKMEEIMNSLAAKNSQIYIKRSKAIYQDNEERSILFKYAVRDFDLKIMADKCFHGKDNVLQNMKKIDNASLLPDDIEFSTLWCRAVEGQLRYMTMTVRTYQTPLISIQNFRISGKLVGAEQTGSPLSTRDAVVNIDEPWGDLTVKKNMPALKFYHDFNWNMDFFEVGWGINFEPAWASVALGLDLLSKPSIDPSKPLPFWDKIRLLLHGRLNLNAQSVSIVLSASRDPNNTTEKMVIVWENFELDWTNACVVIEGDFDLHIRTASKYDDSRVLHFPKFKMRFDLEWLCKGDPNDHHRAVPCNPNKVEDIENHDSYREFRSENLNMCIGFETGKTMSKEEMKATPPTIFLYASTLRWFQKYQAVVLNNVSRPIKRGSHFGNIKPRKPTLGRHYKFLNFDFCFNRLRINYFGSFTQEAGFEMNVSSGSFGANYQVDVQEVLDDMHLTRRPIANWIIRGLHSELDKVSTDLISNLPETEDLVFGEIEDDIINIEKHPKTYFLFSVKRVEYNRQSPGSDMSSFTHKVELNDFKGAWTAFNRKITFELFEAYENVQMLKRVLSSDAMKPSKDAKSQDFRRQHANSFIDLSAANHKGMVEHDNRLLQQLVSEQESKFLAQVEEGENEAEGQAKSAEEDDIIQLNLHIELVNSQVMMKGSESKGALLITAANADIMKRLHRPVAACNDGIMKLNKVTWAGKLNNLQYFATSKDLSDLSSSSIPWINASVISGMPGKSDSENQSNVASFMKSSNFAGSIVNVSFGGVTTEVQRIVSPCHCQFKYVSLDPELDPFAEEFEPTQDTTSGSASYSASSNLANTLLIRHPSLEISTSPNQFAMLLEICQTLLLYTEPKKREKQDRFERMKFRMQLSTGEDTKGEIQELQDSVRDSLSYLRRCERQLFEYHREANSISCMEDDSCLDMALELKSLIVDLQEQIQATKEQLSADSEELKMMILIYKDFALSSASPSPSKGRNKNYVVKQSDIIFDDMRWRLAQQDGQLGIADVQFKKFHYNKLSFDDNGVEHRLELGGFAVNNLIPNEPYKELLVPHEINLRRHVDKSVYVRVYCRVQSPVAGISVREHFEVNVCPIAVRLTHRFYHYLVSFFFSRKSEKVDQADTTDFEMGIKAKDEPEDTQTDQSQVVSSTSFKKPAPPRPPPPKLLPSSKQPSKQQLAMTSPMKQTTVQPTYLDLQAEERLKRKPGLTLTLPASKEAVSSPSPSPSSSTGTPVRTPSVKKGSLFYSRFSTDENVDRMKERASKNQTFIYIKIPKVPICFSYKGEKDRNIEDAHDFNLCLPTLEYHNKTWTWQDLSMALKKDYTQVLVPQIIKEKLHLKGGWDNKQSMEKVGDDDKAKLLLGELPGTQKKTGKKLLFGKLTNLMSKGNSEASKRAAEKEESAVLSGKGVDPLALEDEFNRLRTVSTEQSDKDI